MKSPNQVFTEHLLSAKDERVLRSRLLLGACLHIEQSRHTLSMPAPGSPGQCLSGLEGGRRAPGALPVWWQSQSREASRAAK